MPHVFDKVTCSITVYLKIISKIMECLSQFFADFRSGRKQNFKRSMNLDYSKAVVCFR